MLKTIIIIVAVAIAGVLGFAATKPDSFRVARAASIKGPPEKIFPLINDLHRMQTWSAWEKVDPGMKRIYSGATAGKGAVYEWAGNKELGEGRMEIIDSAPPRSRSRWISSNCARPRTPWSSPCRPMATRRGSRRRFSVRVPICPG